MPEPTQPLAFTRGDITALARRILELQPDPAPRYLVLRDLTGCAPDAPEILDAAQQLLESRWVKQLVEAQQPDGIWGRFHTQDTRVKSAFPTTEFAIHRALALGLDRRSPVLQKATGFIQAHLQGQAVWSDRVENHDHPQVFLHNIRSISAGMLALIEPDHPLLEPLWARWAELVGAAFAGGSYDAKAELARHQALSGISSKGLSPFHVYYPLLILSATRNRLPADLEARMLDYLLHKPDGMYYVCGQSLATLPHPEERGFQAWLHGQEVLARFSGWKVFAPTILNRLWSQRNADGLWDMGKRAGHSFALPLSENWRRPENRMIDSSVRILSLMQQYFCP